MNNATNKNGGSNSTLPTHVQNVSTRLIRTPPFSMKQRPTAVLTRKKIKTLVARCSLNERRMRTATRARKFLLQLVSFSILFAWHAKHNYACWWEKTTRGKQCQPCWSRFLGRRWDRGSSRGALLPPSQGSCARRCVPWNHRHLGGGGIRILQAHSGEPR